jgi:hypothetical protein
MTREEMKERHDGRPSIPYKETERDASTNLPLPSQSCPANLARTRPQTGQAKNRRGGTSSRWPPLPPGRWSLRQVSRASSSLLSFHHAPASHRVQAEGRRATAHYFAGKRGTARGLPPLTEERGTLGGSREASRLSREKGPQSAPSETVPRYGRACQETSLERGRIKPIWAPLGSGRVRGMLSETRGRVSLCARFGRSTRRGAVTAKPPLSRSGSSTSGGLSPDRRNHSRFTHRVPPQCRMTPGFLARLQRTPLSSWCVVSRRLASIGAVRRLPLLRRTSRQSSSAPVGR